MVLISSGMYDNSPSSPDIIIISLEFGNGINYLICLSMTLPYGPNQPIVSFFLFFSF